MSKLSIIPLSFAIMMAVAAPVTLAAVGAPQQGASEIVESQTIRPLTIRQNVSAAPAYGEDDEDCVLQTIRITGPDGKVSISRKLVCADAEID